MRRGVAILVGLLLLALAVVGTPVPATGGSVTLLQAVGRSLGGLRVMASDVLFLRAEKLREEGRLEEVPALYEAVMDLEPDNPAAPEFLAATQGFDMVADAPDAASRFRRWEDAWDLLERARSLHPDDPSLRLAAADLLLQVPKHHADLRAPIEARVGDRYRLALDLLLEAAEAAPVLPRRGRHHLGLLSEIVPVLAYKRLAEGRADPILALGDRLLEIRRDALARMTWSGSHDQGETLVQVPRDVYLRLGLEAVRDLERGGDAALPEVRARLDAKTPGSPLALALDQR